MDIECIETMDIKKTDLLIKNIKTLNVDEHDYDKMTFEECKGVIEGFKIPITEDEKIISSIKAEWLQNFYPLLKFFIETQKDLKISSEQLSFLWLFYCEGININNVFSNINEEKITKILNFENPLQSFLNDSVKEITINGPLIYQAAYHYSLFPLRFGNMKKHYDNIFSKTNDPIEWFKLNKCSYILNYNDEEIPTINSLSYIWEKIMKVQNPERDPIFRK